MGSPDWSGSPLTAGAGRRRAPGNSLIATGPGQGKRNNRTGSGARPFWLQLRHTSGCWVKRLPPFGNPSWAAGSPGWRRTRPCTTNACEGRGCPAEGDCCPSGRPLMAPTSGGVSLFLGQLPGTLLGGTAASGTVPMEPVRGSRTGLRGPGAGLGESIPKATMVRVHGPAVEEKRWGVQDFMQRAVNPNYNNHFSVQPKLDFVQPGAADVIAGESWPPRCGDAIALGHSPDQFLEDHPRLWKSRRTRRERGIHPPSRHRGEEPDPDDPGSPRLGTRPAKQGTGRRTGRTVGTTGTMRTAKKNELLPGRNGNHSKWGDAVL